MIKYIPQQDKYHIYLRPLVLCLSIVGFGLFGFVSWYLLGTVVRTSWGFALSFVGMCVALFGFLMSVFRLLSLSAWFDYPFMVLHSQVITWDTDFVLCCRAIDLVEVERFYRDTSHRAIWAKFEDEARADKLIASATLIAPKDIEPLYLLLNERLLALKAERLSPESHLSPPTHLSPLP